MLPQILQILIFYFSVLRNLFLRFNMLSLMLLTATCFTMRFHKHFKCWQHACMLHHVEQHIAKMFLTLQHVELHVTVTCTLQHVSA